MDVFKIAGEKIAANQTYFDETYKPFKGDRIVTPEKLAELSPADFYDAAAKPVIAQSENLKLNYETDQKTIAERILNNLLEQARNMAAEPKVLLEAVSSFFKDKGFIESFSGDDKEKIVNQLSLILHLAMQKAERMSTSVIKIDLDQKQRAEDTAKITETQRFQALKSVAVDIRGGSGQSENEISSNPSEYFENKVLELKKLLIDVVWAVQFHTPEDMQKAVKKIMVDMANVLAAAEEEYLLLQKQLRDSQNRELPALKVEINQEKRAQQLDEIEATDFFADLKARAASLRNKYANQE